MLKLEKKHNPTYILSLIILNKLSIKIFISSFERMLFIIIININKNFQMIKNNNKQNGRYQVDKINKTNTTTQFS